MEIYLDNPFFNKENQKKLQKGIEDFNYVDISSEMNISNLNKEFKKEYKFADIFAGAGGISKGFSMAGFIPILAVENDINALATYKYNFGKKNNRIKDLQPLDITNSEIKELVIEKLLDEKVDVICGGFPCQGFSLSGRREIDDPRNSLYLDLLEIINRVKPDFIMMENVMGLRTLHKGKVLDKILSDFRNIGYNISVQVLNSADYGVPQERKRLFFIGNRLGVVNLFPKAIIDDPENYITSKDALKKYENLEEDIEFNHILTKHTPKILEKIKKLPEGKALYENYSDSWKRSPANKPSCTIKGNHGAPNIHYKLNRVITPREMAALQSFPDDFIFLGSKSSQLVQIGNAVPPLIAKAIALTIKKKIVERGQNIE